MANVEESTYGQAGGLRRSTRKRRECLIETPPVDRVQATTTKKVKDTVTKNPKRKKLSCDAVANGQDTHQDISLEVTYELLRTRENEETCVKFFNLINICAFINQNIEHPVTQVQLSIAKVDVGANPSRIRQKRQSKA